VSESPSTHRLPRSAPAGETEARARLQTLFAGFDRLTPFELERIGLRRRDDEAREALLHTVAEAARSADRTLLLGEARGQARDTVLRRYRDGGLHPTWVGLNWGISQGTIEDRVAIVEALEDAAAAAVVADLVQPEVVEALALDADRIMDMAAGEVSEGSLAHAVAPPAAGLRDTRGRRIAVWVGALVVGSLAFGMVEVVFGSSAGTDAGMGGAVAAAVVSAGIVVALARRDPGDEPAPDATGGEVAR
jgi:hypothetical protein